MQPASIDDSPISPSRSMTSGARTHSNDGAAASVALLAAAAAARPVLPACSAGNGAGMDGTVCPPPSASPIRIAIYFNVKKRRAFLDPLFGAAKRHDERAHAAAVYDIERHPVTGQRCTVEIIIIENEEEMDTRVRQQSSNTRTAHVAQLHRSQSHRSASAFCLAAQGPFDIVLLKLTDMMTCALYSPDPIARAAAQSSLRRVQSSIARQQLSHPVQLIEAFERVERVLNRATIQTMVQQMGSRTISEDSGVPSCTIPAAFLYQQPPPSQLAPLSADEPAVIIPSSPAMGNMPVLASLPLHMRFPVICKSVAACGTADSHRMYILQRPADFAAMHAHAITHIGKHASLPIAVAANSHSAAAAAAASSSADSPLSPSASSGSSPSSPVWLVQQYINHSAVIYKVYVLDDEVVVVAKPSLPDLHAESPAYSLNSQDMILHTLEPVEVAAAAASAATSAISPAAAAAPASSPVASPSSPLVVPPDVLSVAHECVRQLRRQLQLTLFGFDLIRATHPASAGSGLTPLGVSPPSLSSFGGSGSSSLLHSNGSGSTRYFLIDINYFPSYKTLTGLTHKIITVCLKQQTKMLPPPALQE